MTSLAASRAIVSRVPDMEPLVSITSTTSLGPDAAAAYQSRKRGS